jgi:hypothetical protein
MSVESKFCALDESYRDYQGFLQKHNALYFDRGASYVFPMVMVERKKKWPKVVVYLYGITTKVTASNHLCSSSKNQDRLSSSPASDDAFLHFSIA